MKRTIEIDDTLDETIDAAKLDLAERFAEFRKENPDADPDSWEPHDELFEIADSATPIYTSEIDGLYYLYGNEFEEAYKDAGIGDGSEDNHRQAAIFCYIESKLWEYARELQQEAEDEADEAEADDTATA